MHVDSWIGFGAPFILCALSPPKAELAAVAVAINSSVAPQH